MPSEICSQPYFGPDICPAPTQAALFLAVVTSLVMKMEVKQFCGLNVETIKNIEFDFIVIGGGTAGSAVAARLSEVQNWNVLLIEAGPEEPLHAMIPSNAGQYIGSDIDWKYSTVNEPNACLNKNRNCSWPRGKNLGGCSVHNGMMYTRGIHYDYDMWNIDGWRWKDVLPYFKKAENNHDFQDDYHGTDGPLHVSKFNWKPKIADDILAAAYEAGHGLTNDLNGAYNTGFTIAQTMNKNGMRLSAASAYLRPKHGQKNLYVLLNAQVIKIHIAKQQGQNGYVYNVANGVRLVSNGFLYDIKAKKEVILSAGAVGSPHLLLLSGIGPKDQLDQFNIKPIQYLSGVGENLQNHVSFALPFIIDEANTDTLFNNANDYFYQMKGPLASSGLMQLTGRVASQYTHPTYPDLQFYFIGYTSNCKSSTNGNRTVTIYPTYLHPKSRGTLKLASSNPYDHPIITQNYLTDQSDINGLVEGIKIAIQLTKTKALEKYNFKLQLRPEPACSNFEFMSDAYWACAITRDTSPENHQTSSCKMGYIQNDPVAVVDPTLKVYGVYGLRVADTSVLPTIVSGNTAAPAIMVAERVADFIKHDYEDTCCLFEYTGRRCYKCYK